MSENFVSNNYFQGFMDEVIRFMSKDEEVPDELFSMFVKELSVSTLLIPGIMKEDILTFDAISAEEDGLTILPLFTGNMEFNEYFGEDYESLPIANDFSFYMELIEENDFDGIIINPGSSELLMDKELLMELPLINESDEDEKDIEVYDSEMLFETAKNIKNDSLEEFIHEDKDDFEGLMMTIKNSTLLNLIVSSQDLSEYAENGIISQSDAGEFQLSSLGDEETEFIPLFTGVDNIEKFLESDEYNYYYQIALMDDLFEFVLKQDMDGIIINPDVDDYLIPREYLLEAYRVLTYNNPNYEKAPEYAFLL